MWGPPSTGMECCGWYGGTVLGGCGSRFDFTIGSASPLAVAGRALGRVLPAGDIRVEEGIYGDLAGTGGYWKRAA